MYHLVKILSLLIVKEVIMDPREVRSTDRQYRKLQISHFAKRKIKRDVDIQDIFKKRDILHVAHYYNYKATCRGLTLHQFQKEYGRIIGFVKLYLIKVPTTHRLCDCTPCRLNINVNPSACSFLMLLGRYMPHILPLGTIWDVYVSYKRRSPSFSFNDKYGSRFRSFYILIFL